MYDWFTLLCTLKSLTVKVKIAQLGPTLCDPMDYRVHGTLQARILEWVAFPFSRASSQMRNWTQILYQLSHQGSPRILEWVAYPFSSRSSRPRNWTLVSCIAGGFFTSWATREALSLTIFLYKIKSLKYTIYSKILRNTSCKTGTVWYQQLKVKAKPCICVHVQMQINKCIWTFQISFPQGRG